MKQIADWLEKLGMSEYAEQFAENDIDLSVLVDLTDQDLKELGVASLGHRRKLLRAIADFGAVRKSAPAVAVAAAAPAAPRPLDTAERRQLTVVFCDLVGSTALSARLDPEDMREIVGAYHRCCADLITRAGGFLAKYMGDGVLAYFGYPQAHEHDAEGAVQAGLALVEAVPKLTTAADVPLQVRIGIATGLVVVGDLIGAGAAQEQAVVGETPNLAARLQGIAEPNAVVIADSTRRLLGNLFELRDLGTRDLKGIAGPARAWAALRASSVESRFDALHTSGLTALVGREEELELLLRRWARAKTSEGQVVLLSGEAGIGKSRLSAALMEELAAEPHTRLRYFCSPQHTDSAFYPIIGQFERAAGFVHDDTPQTKLDKLDVLLAQTITSKQVTALLAEMLSLPNDGRYPALDPVPEQRRQQMLEALAIQLETLARSRPVLMIFEDAHWSDPTSLEAFGRTVDRVRTLPVLLILTFRPEFEPPWVGLPHVTALTINRLGERDIDVMIDRVTGNKQLPASIRKDIIERTDGIPLFVEEMTKAVLEAGGELEAMRTAAAVPFPPLAVPPSLHASLFARLDRLGSAKEVAQIGAAVGREFSHSLLSAVVSKPEPELASALDRLVTTGLLSRRGVPPHASYLFKHALVQNAAYGTLLREPRRTLHARIAQILESQFPEIADSQPELVARHCSEAGLIENAARLWGKAGQRSVGRSALVEGTEQLKRALALIRKLPGTPALRREEIKLQVASLGPLMLVKGYASPETREAIERARVLIERAETLGEAPRDPLLLFWVLYSYWLSNYVSSRGDDCCALASQILSLAQKQPSAGPRLIAHRVMGTSLQQIGNFTESQAQFNRSIASFDPAEHRSLGSRFALEKVVSLAHRSLTLWLLGYPATALSDVEQAVHEAQHMGQATPLIIALAITGPPLILRGDEAFAHANSEEVLSLAREKSAGYFRQFGLLNKGSVQIIAGETDDAIRILTAALAELQVSGEIVWRSWYCANLAQAYAAGGHLNDAWRCINEASAAMKEANERWCEPEIYRTTGEIALQQRDEAKARDYFDRALSIARKQQAKSWELRAAMSMARLWREQGKRDEARELLAPVYGWFTEGFDTFDLKQAKALLDELAQ